MSTAGPAPPAATDSVPGASPPPRKPRKIFLLVGVVLAVAIGIGLFTSFGTSNNASGQVVAAGDPLPSFSAPNVGPTGPKDVSVSAHSGSPARPTVLLFFGAWCSACRSELPPIAAAVKRQDQGHGTLSRIRVIGVDTLDSPSTGRSFIQGEGVTFPVASDPDATITQGTFHFQGDPYTVFVNADGSVARVVPGAQLSPASFTVDERALIPSGR
jgi:peroxiredoxin